MVGQGNRDCIRPAHQRSVGGDAVAQQGVGVDEFFGVLFRDDIEAGKDVRDGTGPVRVEIFAEFNGLGLLLEGRSPHFEAQVPLILLGFDVGLRSHLGHRPVGDLDIQLQAGAAAFPGKVSGGADVGFRLVQHIVFVLDQIAGVQLLRHVGAEHNRIECGGTRCLDIAVVDDEGVSDLAVLTGHLDVQVVQVRSLRRAGHGDVHNQDAGLQGIGNAALV